MSYFLTLNFSLSQNPGCCSLQIFACPSHLACCNHQQQAQPGCRWNPLMPASRNPALCCSDPISTPSLVRWLPKEKVPALNSVHADTHAQLLSRPEGGTFLLQPCSLYFPCLGTLSMGLGLLFVSDPWPHLHPHPNNQNSLCRPGWLRTLRCLRSTIGIKGMHHHHTWLRFMSS